LLFNRYFLKYVSQSASMIEYLTNAAQALLNLAAADEGEKRQGCAAEAMRRAVLATRLDPTYAKAHARVAMACDILGEAEAAAESRKKADVCAQVTTGCPGGP
jgi:hypothetical protein